MAAHGHLAGRPVTLLGDDQIDSMSDDSDPLSTDSDDMTWISWFCSLRGNEFFCEVDEEYIQDDFNLTGLSNLVPNYEYALDMILDSEDDLTRDQQEVVEAAAERLYGLIHARFAITTRGVQAMMEKYKNVEFSRCPRVFCQGQPVLPVGQSDVPQTHTVKLFCPRCCDIYYPKNARHQQLDGAYWGTTFPHMLFQTHPELVPTLPEHSYVPRIYGFRISERACNWPRPARKRIADRRDQSGAAAAGSGAGAGAGGGGGAGAAAAAAAAGSQPR